MSQQPIKLQLTAEAIQALFPEGTQARVELQNAVVAEFARKHIKPADLPAGLGAVVKQAQKEATDAAIREIGFRRDAWDAIKPTPEALHAISTQAGKAVDAEIERLIKAHIDNERPLVQLHVERALKQMVDSEIRAVVKARVAAVVEQMGKGVI